jgi:hypothetical protein
MKVVQYQIYWHNLIVAGSVKEAVEAVQSILEDLQRLAQWEKEGKIKAECMNASPSIQEIVVLDESIEPELQKISLVSCFEYEEDEND